MPKLLYLASDTIRNLMSNQKLVTLASFDNAIDAHLLRSKLENEEILCFIFDENMVSLNPLHNITVGGIKVKVMEEDLDVAQKLLDHVSMQPIKNSDGTVLACPNCGSSHVTPGVKTTNIWGFILWILMLGMYPLDMKTKFYCQQCKTMFRRDEAKTPQVS
jgi:hypothetical protein